MLKNRKKYYLSLFLLLFYFVSSNESFSTTKLINRLLININKSHYTQRELEIYLLVKKILENKEESYHMTLETWNQYIEEFTNDFLIYQTAKQLDFYKKTKAKTAGYKDLLEKIKLSKSKHTNIKNKFTQINPNHNEIKKNFRKYTIIREFILRKNSINRTDFSSNKKPLWFLNLYKEYRIRYYKNSNSYEKLSSVTLNNLE